jgi:extracellular elastinolytic metalloproteinase
LIPPAAPPRALLRALAAAATLLAVAAPSADAVDPVAATLDRTAGLSGPPPAKLAQAQDRLRRDLGARALVQPDPTAGTPRIVARLDGFLTPPSRRDPADVALDYVRDHAAAFGLDGSDLATLRLTARRRGAGTVHLVWEQRVDGVPNVDGGLQAAVRDDGRLVNVRGGPLPDPGGSAPAARITAGEAFEAAVPGNPSAPPTGTPRGAERRTPFLRGGEASLVRYRDGGADRLGWRVLYPASSDAFYDAIVDARSGRLQRRVNRTHGAEEINHFDVSPRASGDTSPTPSPVPAGWLGAARRLEGPYVHAISDLTDRIWLTVGPTGLELSALPTEDDEVAPSSPEGDDRAWNFTPTLGPSSGFCTSCSWDDSPLNTTANRQFSTAQLFWYVNTYHDHLAAAPIGFTGVGAGAFEGDDAVIAQALDGASPTPTTGPDADHLSNANMTVLPDGFPGLMQMYLFGLTIAAHYDGAMDASVVYHEYTHGLSERLVTDGQGFGALSGPQPGAISEGTSDFYAMDYLVETEPAAMGDTAGQGDLRFGRWLHSNASPFLKNQAAIRTESMDCLPQPVDSTHCGGPTPATSAGPGGYTYDDFAKIAGAAEVHADGEIWGQTLWSLRQALMAAPAHPGAEGLTRTRAYVTEGLRLAPPFPTFLDMRNAIVQAAVNLHGDEDWDTIWSVFAARGMGWSAATDGPNDLDPLVAGDVPPPPGSGARGAISGTIEDELGAPVPGVSVAVGGHDSGLGATSVQASSAADGSWLLPDVVARSYADLYFRKAGYQELTTTVTVEPGQTATRTIKPLRRDYASAASGGSVASSTGTDYSADGCGPAQAIDDQKSTAWSTDAGSAQDLVLDLGRSIDIGQVRIDPRAGCGDPPEASLNTYELAASDGPGAPFEAIAGGTIGPLDARGYATLSLAGNLAGRRLLRLRAIAPRSLSQAGPQSYMDVSELEVTGTPTVEPTPTPTATPTPSPTATPTPTPQPPPATATTFDVKKLSASRKGVFKVKVKFGSSAPAGTARLRVLAGKKRLAEGRLAVRAGRTSTKTLTLNSTGRKTIKPGKSRKVTLELRLPDGKKVKKTVTLARRKR